MSMIPVVLIVDILSRLPVKSLLRFRSVSKEFRSMIDDPDFIKRRQQHRLLDRTLILQANGHPNLYTIDLESQGNAPPLELEVPFEDWGINFSLIGSCDGLLAMSKRYIGPISVGLWNVSTKKHRILPKFWGDIGEDGDSFDGFGYDVASDDYKWVRVLHSRGRSLTAVTVFCLKANSWRRIEDIPFPPDREYSFDGIGVLVGGSLNWVVRIEGRHMIMSFDLKDEKFYELPLPDVAEYSFPDIAEYIEEYIDYDVRLSVMVLGECLCLSLSHALSFRIDLWVMKEYRVKESWTKLFTFSDIKPGRHRRIHHPSGIVALAYSRCGDALLFYRANGQVFRRDLKNEEAENVLINTWPLSVWYGTTYVESLVSPIV